MIFLVGCAAIFTVIVVGGTVGGRLEDHSRSSLLHRTEVMVDEVAIDAFLVRQLWFIE